MAEPSPREDHPLPGPATEDLDRVLMPVLAGRRLIVLAGGGDAEREALLDRLGRNVDGHGGLGLRVRAAPAADVDALVRAAARTALPAEMPRPDIGVLAERLERRLDEAGFGLLVVEEAQTLSAATLADLAELAGSTTAAGHYLQVLLAGPDGLADAVSGLEAGMAIRPGAVILIGTPEAEPPPAEPEGKGVSDSGPETDDGPLPVPEAGNRRRMIGLSALALACVCAFAGGFGAHAVFFAEGDPLDMVQDLRPVPDAAASAGDAVREAVLPMVPAPGAPGADAFWSRGPGLGRPAGGTPELFEWGDGASLAAAPIPKPPPPRPEAAASTGKGGTATRRHANRPQVAEEGCRRGMGGQTARDASLAGIAQGFLSDLRSLGSCIREGLASD